MNSTNYTMINPITVYALNIIERKDRKRSIRTQFKGKSEFELIVVPVIKHKMGAYGQWKNFVKIVELENEKDSDFFIFCEDDHVFTKYYVYSYLYDCIKQANYLKADILCGGVGFIKDVVPCSNHLFWMKTFNGLQFTVVFNRFYKTIIQHDTQEGFVSDYYLSEISDNKFVMYPFISVQKEFGYSDITYFNKEKGHINKCFKNAANIINRITKAKQFYHTISNELQ